MLAYRHRQSLLAPTLVAGLLLSLALTLTGCAQTSQAQAASPAATTQAADATAVFSSAEYGIRLPYPADWSLQQTPDPAYLLSDQWALYTDTNKTPGQPVVALTLPASNAVTTAQLRIGVSRNPVSVRGCMTTPRATVPGSTGHTAIDGVAFITFLARDAAMSHYMTVQGYRGLHNGLCYALDIVVYGTNPKVYDPPRTPPFSRKQALARLTPIVTGMSFTTPAMAIQTQ